MFRNVLTLIICTAALQAADKTKWIPLFDGKSTKGWEPRAQVESFKAVGDELHLVSKVNVWVVSDLQMSDFIVELEVKIPQENAGVQFGSRFSSGWRKRQT